MLVLTGSQPEQLYPPEPGQEGLVGIGKHLSHPNILDFIENVGLRQSGRKDWLEGLLRKWHPIDL